MFIKEFFFTFYSEFSKSLNNEKALQQLSY